MIIDTTTISAVGGVIGTIIGAAGTWWASKSKAEKSSCDAVIGNLKDLVSLARDEKEQWKIRYDELNAKKEADRKEAHARNEKAQADILELTNKVTDLKDRTDVTPFFNQQNEFNKQFLEGLNLVLKELRELTESKK